MIELYSGLFTPLLLLLSTRIHPSVSRRRVAHFPAREAERLTLLADPGSRDVLARTRVITEAAEAREVVQRLLASGRLSAKRG